LASLYKTEKEICNQIDETLQRAVIPPKADRPPTHQLNCALRFCYPHPDHNVTKAIDELSDVLTTMNTQTWSTHMQFWCTICRTQGATSLIQAIQASSLFNKQETKKPAASSASQRSP